MTKVIIVDDDIDILTMLENDIKESLGYEVLAFTDPVNAFAEIVSSTDIDAIITDERMPNSTGLQLLSAAVEFGFMGHMFIFSGYTDDSMSFELLKVEMQRLKTKSKSCAVAKPSTKKLLGILKDAIEDKFVTEDEL